MQELENATPQLRAKLSLAKRLGTTTDISGERIAFDSQATDVHGLDEDDWQRRFEQSKSR